MMINDRESLEKWYICLPFRLKVQIVEKTAGYENINDYDSEIAVDIAWSLKSYHDKMVMFNLFFKIDASDPDKLTIDQILDEEVAWFLPKTVLINGMGLSHKFNFEHSTLVKRFYEIPVDTQKEIINRYKKDKDFLYNF